MKTDKHKVIKQLPLSFLRLLILLGATTGFTGCFFSAPAYTGPKSAHFDGERFVNPGAVEMKGFRDLLKWGFTRDPGPWVGDANAAPGEPPPERVGPGELRVTFINHATVLIQLDGLNILTDPIYAERASPVTWAGPRRVRPPGIRFEDLPPIDVVLISHNHYDHMDLATLQRLWKEHMPKTFTGLGNARLLAEHGIGQAWDMDWWQYIGLSERVRLLSVPAQHFSSRGLADRNKTLWLGFVLQGTRHQVFFAGDTGYGPHFSEINRRFGSMDLSLLPIGAYRPRWFMAPVHTSPEEAVQAHLDLKSRHSMGIHFGTFPLGDDGEFEPAEDLREAMKSAGLEPDDFWVLGFGEGRSVP